MTTFEDLLAPISLEDFARDTYGQIPLLIEGAADRFDGLFSWNQLNAMLDTDMLLPPRIKLIFERDPVEQYKYARSVNSVVTSLNAAGLTTALRDGAVMIVNFVDRVFPQLNKLADTLSLFTRAGSQINLYCGWQASKGFKIHWDRHDVWVLQIEGQKSWEIWEPTTLHPLEGDKGAAPEGEPDRVLTLTQGDLLYVPRGWWHRAEALDGVSVHMTLGSRAPNAQDFLSALNSQTRDRPEWRATAGPDLESSVQQELAELVSPQGFSAFLDNEAARVWTRPSFNLPEAVTEPKADISGSTLVKLAWTHGLGFRTNGDGTMRVTSDELQMDADVALMPYLARLSGLTWQTIDEVAQGIEDKKVRRKLLFFLTTLEMKSALLTRAG